MSTSAAIGPYAPSVAPMKAIDLFAGAGGFTAGAVRAGLRVVWAGNHNPLAVKVHEQNHPDVVHSCQDLRQADFGALPAYEVLLASPACQGHSTASQSRRRPKHDADRSTAWAVVDCVEATRPRHVVVENVRAFRRWALFAIWCDALRALGYAVDVHEVNAADAGVPQDRARLVVVAHRGRALPWGMPRTSWRPASSILDLGAGGWAPLSAKSPDTRARAARGYANHGGRFLLHQVTDHPGRALDRPIGTITCAAAHWHLVEGDRIRALTTRELARAQGFDDSFHFPDETSHATRLIGNAIPPPLAAAVITAAIGDAA